MDWYFNSRELSCKSPFGAAPAGTEIRFCLRLAPDFCLYDLCLVLCPADHPEQMIRQPLQPRTGDLSWCPWVCTLVHSVPGLYFYWFEGRTEQGDTLQLWKGDQEQEPWQLTLWDPSFTVPDFLSGGIFYQIFPDRFASSGKAKEGVPADRIMHSNWYELPHYLPDEQGNFLCNDYFGGDLEGIRQQLPYLEQLGVTVLYLNPIFEAHSNHRYNTADYRSIDPMLGTEEDFVRLCRDCEAHGIRVILDGVFNHTGSDSIYFNRQGRYPGPGAYNSQQSPWSSWYRFRSWPDDYECWWGFVTLPDVTETDPSYLRFLCGEDGVVPHWLRLGASGWRLDVADELPTPALEAIRAAARGAKDDAAIIGEVWEDASNKVSYGERRSYFQGKQLDSVMNYPFRKAILRFVRDGGGRDCLESILTVLENYPAPVVNALMTSLSTHDTPRAITELAGEPANGRDRQWQAEHQALAPAVYQLGKARLKLAAVLQYLLPGSPCLYYGDEAGLCGYQDPFNRCCYPWGREDRELLDFFRQLGALRRSLSCLKSGQFLPVAVRDRLFAFQRTDGVQSILVAVNPSEEPQQLPLPAPFDGPVCLLSGSIDGNVLPPMGWAVLQADPQL